MKIVLVRHAQTNVQPEINSTLWTLSEDGRRAAAKLAGNAIFDGSECIYSSLQPKAIETAGILGAALHTPVLQEAGLTELSSVTSGFIDDYAGTVHRLYAGEIQNINGGETLEQATNRFNHTVGAIATKHAGADKIVIVSHANVLSLFTAQYCDKEAIDLHNAIAMPDVAVLDWNDSNSTFDQLWGQAI
ncbi:MAG TPA: histidine phosphatase family protein [Candidatus Limnocylindria bacterium]|nr:histidine phosphatase family protein [Candidatus Limnocylindria bacterium]